MKLILALCALLMSAVALASSSELVLKQFPEDNKDYRPGSDGGFDQYKTKSLFGTRKVVLTFDDGPHPIHTPRLLDILKRYNAKATFFVLTKNITASNMHIVKRIVREGHLLASHHHNHENNNGKSESTYKQELKDSISMIAKIMEEENASERELYYRFPYGAYGSKSLSYHHFNVMKEVSQELFGENCINFAFWDIDSLDWLKPMKEKDITSTIMANIDGGTAYNMTTGRLSGKYKKDKYTISRPMGGGVLLMHDIHKKSVDIAEDLLATFKAKGVEVVHMNEVKEFAYNGKTCRLLK